MPAWSRGGQLDSHGRHLRRSSCLDARSAPSAGKGQRTSVRQHIGHGPAWRRWRWRLLRPAESEQHLRAPGSSSSLRSLRRSSGTSINCSGTPRRRPRRMPPAARDAAPARRAASRRGGRRECRSRGPPEQVRRRDRCRPVRGLSRSSRSSSRSARGASARSVDQSPRACLEQPSRRGALVADPVGELDLEFDRERLLGEGRPDRAPSTELVVEPVVLIGCVDGPGGDDHRGEVRVGVVPAETDHRPHSQPGQRQPHAEHGGAKTEEQLAALRVGDRTAPRPVRVHLDLPGRHPDQPRLGVAVRRRAGRRPHDLVGVVAQVDRSPGRRRCAAPRRRHRRALVSPPRLASECTRASGPGKTSVVRPSSAQRTRYGGDPWGPRVSMISPSRTGRSNSPRR